MKKAFSIALFFCACSCDIFAHGHISTVVEEYDKREAVLLGEVEAGLTNRTLDVTCAILELGAIRSSKAVPLLASNLLYRYARNPWGIIVGGVGKTMPIYGPVPRSLSAIKPSLQALLVMLHDKTLSFETRNEVVFPLCLALYGECFIDEMLAANTDYDAMFVSRARSVKQEMFSPNIAAPPEAEWYEIAVDKLIAEYWLSLESNDYSMLSRALFALGHIRALKAKPIILEFLRNPPETASRETIKSHQTALKQIGLTLPELSLELTLVEDDSELQKFLLEYGEETEGDVFLRLLERRQAVHQQRRAVDGN